ncbi:TIR domain-containing protein [Micromonospora chersina]|uniref:TIR domain-containing protein n=1 Tax=Micromonospora chersina TaxID=47854 RepID=UPI003713E2B6
MRPYSVFLVHGRDNHALVAVEQALNEANPQIELVKLNRQAVPGRALAAEIERIGPQCDAAVVLATPDDHVVSSGTGERREARARDNVWLEVGWFWARIGLSRTLLIRQESVALPSDLHGVWHLSYVHSPEETAHDLMQWTTSLTYPSEPSSTELISSTSATGTRAADYEYIHSQAASSLTITGIGMINLRQRLPVLLREIDQRGLNVTLVTMSPAFVQDHQELIDTTYRPGIASDLEQFRTSLKYFSREHKKALGRVDLLGYPGILTFVATAADLSEVGSVMIVEPYLPLGAYSMVDRPRMVLKRRVTGGLYDRYAAGIQAIIAASRPLEEDIA